jgi:hypothetical protein
MVALLQCYRISFVAKHFRVIGTFGLLHSCWEMCFLGEVVRCSSVNTVNAGLVINVCQLNLFTCRITMYALEDSRFIEILGVLSLLSRKCAKVS